MEEEKKCPKCNYKIFPREVFCRKCGTYCPVKTVSEEKNSELDISQENKRMIDEKPEEKVILPNTFNKQETKKIGAIETYIGKNEEKIIKNNFSVCTFFFGPFYFAYRKMLFLSIIWIIIIGLLISLETTIDGYISLIINIIMSFSFKKIYISYVNNKIIKIKTKYSDKSLEEIINILRKKGGTSTKYIFICLTVVIGVISALYFSLLSLLISFIQNNIYTQNNDTPIPQVKMQHIGNLEYEIPSNFVMNSENDTSKKYSILSVTDTCEAYIKLYSMTSYTSAQEALMLKYPNGDINSISVETINDISWTKLLIESSNGDTYHYMYLDNNSLYHFKYIIFNNTNNECLNALNTITNTFVYN